MKIDKKSLKDTIGDFQYFYQVRIPRRIFEDDTLPEKFTIFRWADNIARSCSSSGKNIEVFRPFEGSSRLLICGNYSNVATAASLIRKAVIEICDGKFDTYETKQYVDKVLADIENQTKKEAVRPPSCRVDFKISVNPRENGMNKRQRDSFNKMAGLFDNLGVEIDFPENKPTMVQLSCKDKDALKSAKLTAEWVAKSILAEHKITRNCLQQAFSEQSIQALGRERSDPIRKLAIT